MNEIKIEKKKLIEGTTAIGYTDTAWIDTDADGNAHSGTPAEASLTVCIAPNRPTGLTLNSYNKTTDVLVLDVA